LEEPIEVILTGFRADTSSTTENTYEFAVNGKRYNLVVWHAASGSGSDWFDADTGAWVPGPPGDDDEEDAIDAAVTDLTAELDNVFFPLWDKRVVPVIEAVTAEALAIVRARLDTP